MKHGGQIGGRDHNQGTSQEFTVGPAVVLAVGPGRMRWLPDVEESMDQTW